jgi:hypothetical protein
VLSFVDLPLTIGDLDQERRGPSLLDVALSIRLAARSASPAWRGRRASLVPAILVPIELGRSLRDLDAPRDVAGGSDDAVASA